MPDSRINVGIAFGGVSPEHEVSVISSLQAIHALDPDRYHPVPIYVAKDGTWYSGEKLLDIEAYKDLDRLRQEATHVIIDPGSFGTIDLVAVKKSSLFGRPERFRVDVVFLGFHGGEGENGGMQGLCETFNVPYTGSGVFGSALGMDKVISKMICRDQDIPIVDFLWFRETDWAYREDEWLDRIEQELGLPVVVKPSRLGSSIGIAKADDREKLDAAIEDAFRYDDKIVIEKAVQELREINCSVLGDPQEAIPSVLEEPVRTKGQEMLTFQEKYMRGGGEGAKGRGHAKGAPAVARRGSKQSGAAGMASLDRMIPAPLTEEQTHTIQNISVRVFQLFECAGVARVDCMIDDATGRIYFNEINTIPGSFSFYLWEPTGVPFRELTHRMIEIARARHRAKNGRIRSYDVNLLSEKSLSGLKGAKTG
ncbi:MAG TPA: D-alanine--D-alanine ligase family protein [Rhodothermales bacterium]|nr:D-alanine--D-alanine ligase family protein [Rhodothermales bacterium]